jgi:hypothetical protein
MAGDKPSFPYVLGTGKLAALLRKIPDIGVPDKFTLKTLKSLGYTSSNDERFIPTIKFLGLLNAAGQPTDLWTEARAHLGRAVAKGIRGAYADLFQQYPKAHQKDDEALRTYFSVHSGTGKEAVTLMVQTFKALCGVGDFEENAEGVVEDKNRAAVTGKPADRRERTSRESDSTVSGVTTVSINIQLQLPSDPTGEIYDKFFASMVKHLPVSR